MPSAETIHLSLVAPYVDACSLRETGMRSNITKPDPSQSLLEWMGVQSDGDLFISFPDDRRNPARHTQLPVPLSQRPCPVGQSPSRRVDREIGVTEKAQVAIVDRRGAAQAAGLPVSGSSIDGQGALGLMSVKTRLTSSSVTSLRFRSAGTGWPGRPR